MANPTTRLKDQSAGQPAVTQTHSNTPTGHLQAIGGLFVDSDGYLIAAKEDGTFQFVMTGDGLQKITIHGTVVAG